MKTLANYIHMDVISKFEERSGPLSNQPKLSMQYGEGSAERAIAAVIDLYDQGVRNGDPEALRQAFHPTAYMHGHLDETDLPTHDLCWPIQQFFDRAATFGRGWDVDDVFRSEIVALHVSGAAATIWVRETRGRGGRDYDDFFTLMRSNGEWRITSKVFYQVPREPAGTLS